MSQARIDLINPGDIVFNVNPGDTFTLTLQNIQEFQNSLGIIYIGDTQQRLGVFTNGYYLFKIPNAGSTHKLILSAGQTMAMGGEGQSIYSGEIQLIKPSGQFNSVDFKATITTLDKIQVIAAVAPEQHSYQFRGVFASAPSTGLAQYQLYCDTVENKFFVYDGEVWIEVL